MHVVHRHPRDAGGRGPCHRGRRRTSRSSSITGTTYCVALRYYDESARIEGAWRFADRRYALIYAAPFDRLATPLGGVSVCGGRVQSRLPPSSEETLETWQAFFAGSAPTPDESGDHVLATPIR